jgi:DNA polymerase III delta prime subunit
MTRRQKELAGLVLTFFIGVLTNVATGSLPEEWKPYLWLSWVPLGVCVVVVLALQFVPERGAAEKAGDNQINAQRSQGFIHQASGPISQNFGEQTTINTAGGTVYYQPATTPLDRQQQRNRRAMLAKVKAIWIDGLLEQSLAKELRIALDLTEQPDAVNLPLNALVQELKYPPRKLPPGTPIIEVFDQMRGALLILGAPGAGKTTLLLEVARDLVERAEQDEGHPIPVVFNLSSWATKQRPLKEWLVEELNTKYDVPRKIAQSWMDTDVVLPLLDGLDEVSANQRNACVESINIYRGEHGLVPLTVCSRLADYEALTTKLRLQGAVLVQTLTQSQVGAYLESTGEKLVGVRSALQHDAELGEMLDTPLMLSIVTLAYAEKSAAEVQSAGTLEERRRHLFDAYITAMFGRRSKETDYTHEQTRHCLFWLARQMAHSAQTILLIEQLQPEWLPSQATRRWYTVLDRSSSMLLYGLVGGLGIGLGFVRVHGLGFGLRFGLLLGLGFGLAAACLGGTSGVATLQQRHIARVVLDALQGALVGLLGGVLGGALGGALSFSLLDTLDIKLYLGLYFGLTFGLYGGLLGGLHGILAGQSGLHPRRVIIVERLQWSWRTALLSMLSGLVSGLCVGLVFVLVFGGIFGLTGGFVRRLGIVMQGGLIGGLGGGLVGGLRNGPISTSIRPNQGIGRSARSALVAGLGGGLIGGLVFGLANGSFGGLGFGVIEGRSFGLVDGLGFGLLIGLASGLSFGGYTSLSHLTLRLLLYRNGSLPLRLVPFLDYCVERVFLRKVGGGYIFVHRLLMEHFASLQDARTKEIG